MLSERRANSRIISFACALYTVVFTNFSSVASTCIFTGSSSAPMKSRVSSPSSKTLSLVRSMFIGYLSASRPMTMLSTTTTMKATAATRA